MSFAPSKRKDKAASANVEETDLDVTPVMNILVILIPFLVSMAVFTQIAVIQFSLPPAAEGGGESQEQAPQEKKLELTVIISSDSGFTITGTNRRFRINKTAGGSYDFKKLKDFLQSVKRDYPSHEDVILLAGQEVIYDDIIQTMDICRESKFPNIGLSAGVTSGG
ncbi:MAG: ExbD/TolR family protein [Fibrobacterota bacterium]